MGEMRGNDMDRILDVATERADKAEAYVVEREDTPIEFRSDKLHSLSKRYAKGVGLRVVKDGRIGFSSTTDLSKLDELVDNALESAEYGQQIRFEFPGGAEYPDVKMLSQAVKEFPSEAGIQEGRKAISMIKEGNQEITCDVDIRKRVERVTLANSNGLNQTYEKSAFSYAISGLMVIDGSLCWLWEGRSSSDLCLETDDLVSSMLTKAKLAQRTVPAPQRRLPVVFAPRAVVSLLQALFLGISGKNVQKGSSPLAGRVGEEILDRKFSLCDDGTKEFGLRTAPFDGEGVPSQRTVLFEKGVLKSHIFDLQTAGVLGVTSTGNGVRDFNTQPVPAPSNPVVEPREWSFQDMISDIKEGIVVHDVLGAGQSNLLAGDFSLNLSLAYKIEQGELVARVKDCMIAGNVYQDFREIAGIGDEAEEVSGVYTPAFYFPGMMVTAKG